MLAVQVARRKVDGAEVAREAQLGGKLPLPETHSSSPPENRPKRPQKGLDNHPFFKGENVSFRAGNTKKKKAYM